jgi:CubicO group peptidase (beta-lactamase class C family)
MRLSRRSLLAGSLSVLAAPRATATALAEPAAAARERIGALAAGYLREFPVPGLSVAFARGGRVAYAGAFGVADREAGTALATTHRFRLASVSKPITAVAVFTLVDAGRLSLDARVLGPAGLLGEPAGPIPEGSRLRDVTVRHLLTHTAGGWPNDATDPMFLPPRLGMAEIVAAGLRMPLANAPGASYAYSNFGYCLLGRAIEKVAGKPYEAYVREAVLRPAGAAGMAIAGNTPAERRPDEVRYHGQDGQDPYAINVARMDAHGGWIASASDVALFADAAGPPLLGAGSTKAMTTGSPANPRYACGWSVNAAGNRWHGGSLAGTTTLAVRTASGLCWAGLANTRQRKDGMAPALDRLLWAMARAVPEWRA